MSQININGEIREAAGLKLPASGREFRAAWQFNGDAVEVDMVKAREIHREKLRRARKPLLEALDAEWFRAMESGGDVASIVAKKEALRQVTKDARIESASTPEELLELDLESLISKPKGRKSR